MKITETIILASGILKNQKGDILLVKRSKTNKTFKDFWQLPEGKTQPGEQPIETLARELNEELACQLISAQPVATSAAIVSFGGKIYHLVRIGFRVKWEGKIILSEEHNDYRWVNINKAIKMPNLVDGTKEILLVLK